LRGKITFHGGKKNCPKRRLVEGNQGASKKKPQNGCKKTGGEKKKPNRRHMGHWHATVGRGKTNREGEEENRGGRAGRQGGFRDKKKCESLPHGKAKSSKRNAKKRKTTSKRKSLRGESGQIQNQSCTRGGKQVENLGVAKGGTNLLRAKDQKVLFVG